MGSSLPGACSPSTQGTLYEANPSLWVGTRTETHYHELHSDMQTDVAVVADLNGAGGDA